MVDANEKRMIAKFQRNLEALRQIAGWSVEDLAQKIGVNKQTIRNLELAAKSGKNGKPEMSKLQYIGLRAVFDYEAQQNQNDLLAQVMPILLNPDETEDEAIETEEKVLTVAAAKAGGASSSAILKVLKALFPIAGAATTIVSAVWLGDLFKSKK